MWSTHKESLWCFSSRVLCCPPWIPSYELIAATLTSITGYTESILINHASVWHTWFYGVLQWFAFLLGCITSPMWYVVCRYVISLQLSVRGRLYYTDWLAFQTGRQLEAWCRFLPISAMSPSFCFEAYSPYCYSYDYTPLLGLGRCKFHPTCRSTISSSLLHQPCRAVVSNKNGC